MFWLGWLSGTSECHKKCHSSLREAPQNREEEGTGKDQWLAPACGNLIDLLYVSRLRQVLVNSVPRLRTRRSGVRISQAVRIFFAREACLSIILSTGDVSPQTCVDRMLAAPALVSQCG